MLTEIFVVFSLYEFQQKVVVHIQNPISTLDIGLTHKVWMGVCNERQRWTECTKKKNWIEINVRVYFYFHAFSSFSVEIICEIK